MYFTREQIVGLKFALKIAFENSQNLQMERADNGPVPH